MRIDAFKTYLLLSGWRRFAMETIYVANMVYMVTLAQLTPLELVLVGTALEVAILLFEIPTGVVADVYSRRLSLVLGFVVMGAGFVLEGSIPQFWAIALAQFIWGLGYTFTSGATQAWLSDEIGEESANAGFIRGAQVANLCGLAGLGAGVLLSGLAVNVPVILGGVLLMLLGLALAVVMPETGFKPLPRAQRSSWQQMTYTFRRGLGMLQQRPALATVLWVGFFYGLFSEGYDRLWVKHLVDNFTLPFQPWMTPVAWVAAISVVVTLVETAAAEALRRRLNTNDQRAVVRALFALTTLLAFSLVVFAQMPDLFFLMLLPRIAISVSRGLIDPIYTAWVNQRLDPQVRATVISLSGQVDAVGQIASGPLAGLVGQFLSVRAAITFAGLLLTPALALFARAKAEPPPAEPQGVVK